MNFTYLPYKHNFLTDIHQVKNLLVIVAMESEEKALLDGMSFKTKTIGHRTLFSVKEFHLPKCNVTISRCGIGIANAAVLLSMIAESIPIDAIVLLGVGGALDEKLQVGDTVISRQIIQHDSISSTEDRKIFIAPGELTLSTSTEKQVDPVMKCDEVLIRWIREGIEISHKGKFFEGTILSGSEFAANSSRKKQLKQMDSQALMVDMEAAALAQFSRKLQIPFVAAKTVADRASPDTSVSEDYSIFLSSATAHSKSVLDKILETFS